jgi:hypothetical protein
MTPESPSIRQRLRTPRAAAIAGIVFSLLLISSMSLIWISIPATPLDAGADVMRNSRRISLALDMLPFAGIAFLWFVGVLRDRLGELEDRFFATVFLGSALLYLAMIFTAAATAGGLLRLLGSGAGPLLQSGAYALGRIQIHQTMHVYALKMAGVFMISTATISLRTRIVPRWMAFLGYALAAVLLVLSVGTTQWIPLVFPLWVLLISTYVLFDNLRRARPAVPPADR